MLNATLDYDKYGSDVLAGLIPVCKWTRLAVERHYRDLENAHERGLVFSEEHARHALRFFDFLKHSKGKWARQPFMLSDWQAFWTALMFGWLRFDGTRRYRKAYFRVARKNGKTTWIAGIGLYLFVGDGEAGAEVFTAATKLSQAKLIHVESEMMVRQSKELSKHITIQRNNLFIDGTSCKYVPLGADAKTEDGLNPHGALIDELHAHPSRELYDVIDSATGAREQPLMLMITTAGFGGLETICRVEDEYVKGILEETLEDDKYFGVIYQLDEAEKLGDDFEDSDEKSDNWQDESTWIKANPNLGVSVNIEKLREAATKAKQDPSALDNFLTKHLDMWVKGARKWMPLKQWKKCAAKYTFDDLKTADAVFAGLDLASVSDLCSLVIVANMPDGKKRIWGKHYLPEDKALSTENKNAALYKRWADAGWLTLTEGNVTDYDYIERDIHAMMSCLPIQEVAFDKYNATQIVNNLQAEDVPMVEFRQGFLSMSPAMKQLEIDILTGKLQHPNDPVINWAISNVVMSRDAAGNQKPDKEKSIGKIDPVVAMIMATGRSNAFAEDIPSSITVF
jgi:phage terminase large subunit-like protein